MKNKIALLVIICAYLSGCATVKVPAATDGSRSDGTVDMSFQYGMFEKPKVDWVKAAEEARKRCVAWDYSNAEPFGGAKTTCQAYNNYGGCIRQLVTMKYQCIGYP